MARKWVKYAVLSTYIVCFIILGVLIAKLGPNQCVRRDCVRKSKFILKSMNLEVNPCDNFFRFSCDNYKTLVDFRVKKKNTMYPFASVISHIEDDINKHLREMLNDPSQVTDDRTLKIVKKIFQPCRSNALVSRQGVRPLWDAISKAGGFPLLKGKEWNGQQFSLSDVEYKSRKNGFRGEHLFQSYIGLDSRTSGQYYIHIEPPSFYKVPGHELITLSGIDQAQLRSNYESFTLRLLFYLLGKPDYEDAKYEDLRKSYSPDMVDCTQFKIELGKIYDTYMHLEDPIDVYNQMPLDSLETEFPYLNWKKYFKNMMPPSSRLPQKVIVIGTSYFKGLKNVIEKTKKRTVVNYIIYQNILDAIRFLPHIYFAIYNKFLSNVINVEQLSFITRRGFCQDMVENTLRTVMSSLFLESYNITDKSQAILEEMSERMQAVIKRSITNSHWMDKESKEQAYLKLKYTKFTLSLSDKELEELQNKELRARYYEELCLGTRETHVLPNYFCLNKFRVKNNWELLSRKATIFDKRIRIFNSHISYDQKKNGIDIPFGLLKYPAFSGAWPSYLNFGGIGVRFGNKFTNGYDLDGGMYNYLGFMKSPWWSNVTRGNYMTDAQCFTDDYCKFVRLKGVTNTTGVVKMVPGELSEFQGLHVAYEAYLSYYSDRFLKEPSLPGLEDFTPKQLFFIGYANTHCATYRPENETEWLANSGKIYPQFEVNKSLQNEKGFSEAFECKKGSKMNPTSKCNLMW